MISGSTSWMAAAKAGELDVWGCFFQGGTGGLVLLLEGSGERMQGKCPPALLGYGEAPSETSVQAD